VNAQSGFGPWPYGLEMLLGLVKKIKTEKPAAGP
jgi:predicted alpha/beta hydrolase family esterase